MKKRRLKKNVKFTLIGIVALIVLLIIGVNYIKYINSYQYKFKNIGYSKEEIDYIVKLDKTSIDKLLKIEYNDITIKLMKEKYFIFDNLNEYIKYYEDNKKDDLSHIISIVNVKANNEYYDEDIIKPTNVDDGILMLVNKFHYLSEDYNPDDIVKISNMYSYDNNSIKEEVYTQYKKMWNAAKKEDLTLIVTSSYRKYDVQDELWTSRANNQGEEEADKETARAGFSEHQTGLALDIVTYNSLLNDFENTDEFKWLQKNAHKYGFILRYPKDKEDITGYSYESWHYRYVGVEVATKIYEEKITFDEYYAYYLDK